MSLLEGRKALHTYIRTDGPTHALIESLRQPCSNQYLHDDITPVRWKIVTARKQGQKMKEKDDVMDIDNVAVGGIEREWRRPSAAGNQV